MFCFTQHTNVGTTSKFYLTGIPKAMITYNKNAELKTAVSRCEKCLIQDIECKGLVLRYVVPSVYNG